MAVNAKPTRVVPQPSAVERARAARQAAEVALAEATEAEAAADREAESIALTQSSSIDSGDSNFIDEAISDHQDDADVPSRKSSRRRSMVVCALIAVMVTALCASNVYLAVAHRDAEAAKAQRLAYVQAARQGVVNILSVNFNTADSDVQRILDGATGAWRDEFSPQAAPFIDVVKQAQVVTTADITEAGLERIGDDDTAQVLIAATSKVTNAAGANEDPRSFRVRVSLSRDSGQLKVSKMEYVPS